MPHHHIPRFVVGTVLRVTVLFPILGFRRSGALITKGGRLGVVGGLIGIIFYPLAVIAGIFGIVNSLDVTYIPAHDALLGTPGTPAAPGACLRPLSCIYVAAGHDTGQLIVDLLVVLVGFFLIEWVGYFVQWLFGLWSKTELLKLKEGLS